MNAILVFTWIYQDGDFVDALYLYAVGKWHVAIVEQNKPKNSDHQAWRDECCRALDSNFDKLVMFNPASGKTLVHESGKTPVYLLLKLSN